MTAGYSKAPTRHTFPLFDFGGGADGFFAVCGPKGRTGQLVNYGVDGIVEAMNGGTLMPMLSVGTYADRDLYGEEFTLKGNAVRTATSVLSENGSAEEISLYILEAALDMPADGTVGLSCIAGTGAGLTGQGTPWVEIVWDN